MTFEEYKQLDACNWSSLKLMRKSPKHFKAGTSTPREDSDALRLGRAVHCATLEPAEFGQRYAIWDQGRRAGKKWDEFVASAVERKMEVLTEEQADNARTIGAIVRTHSLVKPLLELGKAEQTLLWTDAATGIKCKARLDLVGEAFLLDLKTARNAVDFRKFQSDAYSAGYLGQCAFYARGMKASGYAEPVQYIAAVETTPPFDLMVAKIDEDAAWRMDQEVDALLKRLKECIDGDSWPGVFDTVQSLAIPRWADWDAEDAAEVLEPDWVSGTTMTRPRF